jgi:hypothetical protein
MPLGPAVRAAEEHHGSLIISRHRSALAAEHVIVVTILIQIMESWAHSRCPSGPTRRGPRTRGIRHANRWRDYRSRHSRH